MFDRKSDNEEQVVPEADDLEGDDIETLEQEEQLTNIIKSLKKELREIKKQNAQHLEEAQRAKADFLNSKRRLEDQLQLDKERVKDAFFVELLPLIDSFDLAIAEEKASKKTDSKVWEGVVAIHAQLHALLAKHNVSEIDPLNEPFDPEKHEAVSNTGVEDDTQVDTVLAVHQKGYELGNRLLRPARVSVGVRK